MRSSNHPTPPGGTGGGRGGRQQQQQQQQQRRGRGRFKKQARNVLLKSLFGLILLVALSSYMYLYMFFSLTTTTTNDNSHATTTSSSTSITSSRRFHFMNEMMTASFWSSSSSTKSRSSQSQTQTKVPALLTPDKEQSLLSFGRRNERQHAPLSSQAFIKQQQIFRLDQLNMLRNVQPLSGDSRYMTTATTRTKKQATDTAASPSISLQPPVILKYGHVMKELAQRILSRSIASSNVIIFRNDHDHDKNHSNNYTSAASNTTTSVGWNLQQEAQRQGHDTYVVIPSSKGDNQNVYLDTWYTQQQQLNRGPGSWWLLTVLDTGVDNIFSSSEGAASFLSPSHINYNNNNNNITSISGPTMTYVICKVTATTNGIELPPFSNAITYTGHQTVLHFLHHHYKVQVLSMTDYWNSHLLGHVQQQRPLDDAELTPTEQEPQYKQTVFQPNDLLTVDNLYDFLEWGAIAAVTSQTMARGRRQTSSTTTMTSTTNDATKLTPNNTLAAGIGHDNTTASSGSPPAVFEAYLFLTQGLDLAIPSRRAYVQGGALERKTWKFPYRNATWVRRHTVERVPLLTCPHVERFHDRLRVEFKDPNNHKSGSTSTNQNHHDGDEYHELNIICDGVDITQQAFSVWNNKQGTSSFLDESESKPIAVDIWMNQKDIFNAESVCVKLNCNHFVATDTPSTPHAPLKIKLPSDNQIPPPPPYQIACQTRILPKLEHSPAPLTQKKKQTLPNILLIMLDPLSLPQFDFIMPRTQTWLQEAEQHEFARFEKYVTVGNNSGPNQVALYSGTTLHDRNGVSSSSSSSSSGKNHKKKWLWDLLRQDFGYATFKAEDGCIANSNMMQSIQPNTTHGSALHELFCFHFARPNCVGPKLAAEYLLDHTQQFIQAYGSTTRSSTHDENNQDERNNNGDDTFKTKTDTPWAAFVSLVDTHEDTMTLGAVIDKPLASFLNDTMSSPSMRKNTVVLVVSDHGLHYGPYFQSLAGERERSQPILFMHVPKKYNRQNGSDITGSHRYKSNLWLNRKDAWVTPFDVHATLLDLVRGQADDEDEKIHDAPHQGEIPKDEMAKRLGQSLFTNLVSTRQKCRDAPGVPQRHCDLVDGTVSIDERLDVPLPPSLTSFYADIPRDHRLKNPLCKPPKNSMLKAFDLMKMANKTCACGTSHRDWFNCTQHPWLPNRATSFPRETFVMLKCENRPLHLDLRIVRNNALLKQVEQRQQRQQRLQQTQQEEEENERQELGEKKNKKKPSILFLELDSVSVPYANRHFPKTRALLKRFQPVPPSTECPVQGFCGVDFTNFGVAGPNSIVNQVAAFSGCFTTLRHESCFDREAQVGDICKDPSVYEYGLQLQSIGPGQHMVYCPPHVKASSSPSFLYDIAKEQGYVTFFGEEFCYDGSPWVVQDNVFPLKADIELHRVFCRFQKLLYPTSNAIYKEAFTKCTEANMTGKRTQDIGLELLQQMWKVYPGVPKFAYLNSMAAHVYTSNSPTLAFDAEDFDETLSKFLDWLFRGGSRSSDTIVIVRSDHGLQGGFAVPLDYSTQLEQRHPWTEMVIPSAYPVDTLLANSNKRVTPFDLYAMLKNLLTQDQQPQRRQPPWAIDLMRDLVPARRSCQETMVIPEYCPYEDVPFPNFGICNMYEGGQAVFCRDRTNGAKLYFNREAYQWQMDAKKRRDEEMGLQAVKASTLPKRSFFPVVANETSKVDLVPAASNREGKVSNLGILAHTVRGIVMNRLPKDNAQTDEPIPPLLNLPCGRSRSPALPAYQRAGLLWHHLKIIRRKNLVPGPSTKPPGGIFLHHRQAFALATLLQEMEGSATNMIRVCQVGFDGGDSAAVFLSASKQRVELVTFDAFDKPYQLKVLEKLRSEFGANRIKHVTGDPCVTVPTFFENVETRGPQCDVIYSSTKCPSDMTNLIKHLRPGGFVSADATASLETSDMYFGPTGQWRRLRQDSCITQITCWKEQKTTLVESYDFADAGTDIQFEFCIATNTGRCSDRRANVPHVEQKEIHYDRICLSRQLEFIPL